MRVVCADGEERYLEEMESGYIPAVGGKRMSQRRTAR